MLVLDIENTLIDDLIERNWLNDNIIKIKSFIHTDCPDISTFSIFTFGWLNNSEIDWQLIHFIESKLELRCQYVWTKSTVLKFLINNFTDHIFSIQEEFDLSNQFNLNKELGMITIKDLANDSCIDFIDDTVDDKSIFFGNKNLIKRDNINFININNL